MKHLYKFIALLFIFGFALFLFGQSIPDVSVTTATTTSLQNSTFPLIQLQLGNYTVNTLHGYSSELDSSRIRECITPLDSSKTFTTLITQNESKIKRLSYELKDIANNKIIASDTMMAFDTVDKSKAAKIKLDAAMDTSTEYGLMIILTTNSSKKIHFYTRIKYYDSNFYLKEKLDFVNSFHNATFDNGKSLRIQNYLDPTTRADKTLANVTSSSSYKMITWAKLNPKQITKNVPMIKELNIETAAIEQDYYISAKTDSGTEIYHVKEFYRVRYTGDRIYLLYFQRKMEAIFDPAFTSLTQSEFKIGITNSKDLNITSSDSNKKLAFVRNGSLWYYDLDARKLHQVFTYEQGTKDYSRDYYDQHNIRILKMDEDGNISFVVYGYMNSGDYEGRVGILLYDYSSETNRITERLYIPLTTTYQQLKEDFGSYCYLNNMNKFFFSLSNKVYAYNLASKRYEVLTDNANADNFSTLKKAKCYAWSSVNKKSNTTSITILNLDTEKQMTVNGSATDTIKVLGSIDGNVIYGYVHNKDKYQSTEGESISPVYKMVISTCDGKILKEYQTRGIYITKVSVDGNIVRLTRVRRRNGKFLPIADDSVQSQKDIIFQAFHLSSRSPAKTLTEKYITLPAGYTMDKMPGVSTTKYVLQTENTTFHLDTSNTNTTTYYVYAYGGITTACSNAGDAILQADAQMGVVMDSDNNIVWERGGKFLSKSLSGFTKLRTNSGMNSAKACVLMLLQASQNTVSSNEIKGNSMVDQLSPYLNTVVNLSGCTVDEILYFVSNGKPVIAMKDSTHAVIISAYDSSSVTWYDPTTGAINRMTIANAEKYFKAAGYLFVSYIRD